MVSRWQDVAKKAAEKLGVDPDTYTQYIEDWGKIIQSHASKPTVMETDVFGVGYFKASFGKITKELQTLRVKLDIRQRRLKRYENRDVDLEPMKKLISNVEEDIQILETFLGEKDTIAKEGIARRDAEESYRSEKGNYRQQQRALAAEKREAKRLKRAEAEKIKAEKAALKNEKRLAKLAIAAERAAKRERKLKSK